MFLRNSMAQGRGNTTNEPWYVSTCPRLCKEVVRSYGYPHLWMCRLVSNHLYLLQQKLTVFDSLHVSNSCLASRRFNVTESEINKSPVLERTRCRRWLYVTLGLSVTKDTWNFDTHKDIGPPTEFDAVRIFTLALVIFWWTASLNTSVSLEGPWKRVGDLFWHSAILSFTEHVGPELTL